MGEDCVSRDTVITVLKMMCDGLGMALYVINGHVIIVKNGIPEVQPLSDPVGRKVLGRLAGKFGIPIHYFFHPEQVTPGTKTAQ